MRPVVFSCEQREGNTSEPRRDLEKKTGQGQVQRRGKREKSGGGGGKAKGKWSSCCRSRLLLMLSMRL